MSSKVILLRLGVEHQELQKDVVKRKIDACEMKEGRRRFASCTGGLNTSEVGPKATTIHHEPLPKESTVVN